MKRKLEENEEMERDSLSTFPHFLFIIANVTNKNYHMRYEKIILGRIRCKKSSECCTSLHFAQKPISLSQ